MEEADIRVSNMQVGKIRLDLAKIRGEGGTYDPRLVLPIKIELYPQPPEHQIAIQRISASIHLDQYPSLNNQFASKIICDTIYNMPLRSVPTGSNDTDFDLYFSLTPAQLKALENMRHQPGKNLYLHLDPVIVWNKHTGNNQGHVGGSSTLGENGWDINVGMFSDVAFFWLPKIGTLRLDLAVIDWRDASTRFSGDRLGGESIPRNGI